MPATSKEYHREKLKAWRAANPEAHKEHGRRYNARVSQELLSTREKAAGRPRPAHCEVCGEAGKIVWDHCHATKKFRGWICDPCNKALGFVRDNPIRLRALADYVSPNSNHRIN